MKSFDYLFDIKPFTKIVKNDYLLVVSPEQEIATKIMYFKLKAWEKIGVYPSLHSLPHITINHDYDIKASVFEEKLKYYKQKVARINTFKVEICGFDFFNHGVNYTIYAKVDISNTVKETLVKFNQTFAKHVVSIPHITVVRTIPKEKFDIVWPYFKDIEFECCFYADKISVLETPTRKLHNMPLRKKTEIYLNRFGKKYNSGNLIV